MINLHLQFKDVAEMRVCLTEMLTGVPRTVVAMSNAEGSSMPEAIKAAASLPAPTETPKVKPPKSEKPVATQPVSATATPATTAPAEPAAASESPSEPITLEQVRAKLTELSQGGKAAEVKALITAMGAAKLTDVASDKYPEMLEKAAAL